MATNSNSSINETYNITTSSSVSIEDSNFLLNDTKAQEHNRVNSFSTNTFLLKALEKQSIKQAKTTEHAVVCSVSGYATTIQLPSIVSDSVLLNFSMPMQVFKDISNAKAEELYSMPVALLASTVTALYHRDNLVKSMNASRGMDTKMLASAGVYHLVQAILIYKHIKDLSIDLDMLPKLDISFETHSEGIVTMEQPLSNYLSLLDSELSKIKDYEANKTKIERERKLQLEAIALERRNAKSIKQVETQYEEKRRLAVKALKAASIDLVYMNYKKLTTVLTSAIVTKNGAELMSKETKTKILVRLDEVSASSKDTTFLHDISIIKAFITLANSDRVETRKESALERASDIMTVKTTALSLKEKLLAMQARK